jgi:hypothetical protein
MTTEKHPIESRQELADETFMSAADLRKYMTEMQMAKATKSVQGMDRVAKAREEMIARMSEPLDLTPEKLRDIVRVLKSKVKSAAERGQTELMVMRFPNEVCTDSGRAINNSDPTWPETLKGRPRQAFELWRDHLKAAGFKLTAMIIDWPGGLPGDVGFFLKWGDSKL